MANYTADQLTQVTDPSAYAFACAPFSGGSSGFALCTQITTYGALAGGLQLPSNSGGAGYDLTLSAGDAGASGRGGNVYIKVGLQNTSGGNGSVIFLDQTGATVLTMDATGKLLVSSSQDVGLDRAALGIFKITNATTGGGSMSAVKGASNLTVTGTTNNLALDSSQFQRLTGASTPVLTGVAPPSGGAHVDGNIRYLYCLGATSIVISHNDASSTAANRIYCSTGANITLAQNQSVRLTYDATDNGSGAAGWRCTAAS